MISNEVQVLKTKGSPKPIYRLLEDSVPPECYVISLGFCFMALGALIVRFYHFLS